MKLSRNAPCPCGSGRKYKSCCWEADAGGGAVASRLPVEVRAEARRHSTWEADVLGLPVEISGIEDGRPVAVMVCAGPVVVGLDQRVCRSAEPDDVARLLERALAGAFEAVGGHPRRVRVRHSDVAAALDRRLDRGPAVPGPGDRPHVTVSFRLPALDPAAREMVRRLAGTELWPPVAGAATAAAWGLPREELAALFQVLAAYHRAAPWRLLDDVPPLTARWPDGAERTLSVLGAAGEAYGLAMYADRADFDAMIAADHPAAGLGDMGAWALSFTFVERGDLPRTMQREFARAGWEVAAPDAYPLFMPMLTPAGGITRDAARRLAEAARAVVELVGTERSRLAGGEPAGIETAGGVRLGYPGEDDEERDRRGRVPEDLRDVVEELRSGRFTSEREAEAFVAERIQAYNQAPRDALSGLSPSQAHQLLDGDWDGSGPLTLADDLSLDELAGADFVHNARTLLAAIEEHGGVPATTAGNLKRALVDEMLEAGRWPPDWLETIRSGQGPINEADARILHVLRVVLEVAGLLELRKGRFTVTARGRELLPEAAAGRLMAHLFRTYFREFNIGYGGRGPDTEEIQHYVPLILARLGREAGQWVDRDELARRLLPPARQPADPGRVLDPATVQRIGLSVHVLGPLTWFGLLEQERSEGRDRLADVRVRATPLLQRFVRVSFG